MKYNYTFDLPDEILDYIEVDGKEVAVYQKVKATFLTMIYNVKPGVENTSIQVLVEKFTNKGDLIKSYTKEINTIKGTYLRQDGSLIGDINKVLELYGSKTQVEVEETNEQGELVKVMKDEYLKDDEGNYIFTEDIREAVDFYLNIAENVPVKINSLIKSVILRASLEGRL